jgi:hypothetical protein
MRKRQPYSPDGGDADALPSEGAATLPPAPESCATLKELIEQRCKDLLRFQASSPKELVDAIKVAAEWYHKTSGQGEWGSKLTGVERQE